MSLSTSSDLAYFVNDQKSPPVQKVPDAIVTYEMTAPYSAPVEHRLPEYQRNVPHLLGEGMVVNPAFTVDTTPEWLEKAYESIEAMITNTRNNFQDATGVVRTIEERLPEFCTQLNEDEYQNIDRASRETLHQIHHAFSRLVEGHWTEKDIYKKSQDLEIWADSYTVDKISNEHVRQRIMQAKKLWNDMIQNPYRNLLYRIPVRAPESKEESFAMRNQEGALLAKMGPSFYSYQQKDTGGMVKTPGGFGLNHRFISVHANDAPAFAVQTLIHELIHAVQAQEALNEFGIEEARRRTQVLMDMNSRVPIWNPQTEIEASWCEAHLANAQMPTSKRELGAYLRKNTLDEMEKTHMSVLLDIARTSPKAKDSEIPREFSRKMITKVEKQGYRIV